MKGDLEQFPELCFFLPNTKGPHEMSKIAAAMD